MLVAGNKWRRQLDSQVKTVAFRSIHGHPLYLILFYSLANAFHVASEVGYQYRPAELNHLFPVMYAHNHDVLSATMLLRKEQQILPGTPLESLSLKNLLSIHTC